MKMQLIPSDFGFFPSVHTLSDPEWLDFDGAPP
jgi:hypothetical protein